MKGKIVYRFQSPAYPGNILYVNIIGNYCCFNDCLFCSRPRSKKEAGKRTIYEKKAGALLYLPKSPSLEKVLKAVEREIREDDKEVAIIGLGEPLVYLEKVVELIKKIKERHWVKVRVDTNGLAKCINKKAAKMLEEAGLDEIRISLNAINKEDYNRLCRPRLENSFQNLVSFVKECNNSKIRTFVSFVTGFKVKNAPKRTRKEFKEFALSLGIKPENIIFRKYIPPL